MDACKDLRDYSIYVAKLRSYMDRNGGDIENTDTLSTFLLYPQNICFAI